MDKHQPTSQPEPTRAKALLRALPPEILTPSDIGVILGIHPAAVRERIVAGDFGPHFRVGRRLFLRRDVFLAALAAREVKAAEPAALPSIPKPDPRIVAMLQGGGR